MPTPHTVSLVCQSIMNGANVAFAMYPGLSRGAMDVILKVGSKEQKDTYVPNMLSGLWGGTMCLTEPGAGLQIDLVSPTMKQYGAMIRQVIEKVLTANGIADAMVHANDKGALDYTIEARMQTAIDRAVGKG